jgi:RNA polymerase sigma factor (sigma-70 family)
VEIGRRGEGTIQNAVLIEQIRAGDEQAFRHFIEQYHQYIYKTVYAVLRNEKDAEDAAQEAFVKIYYALPQYEAQGLKTWMTRIALNHAIDMRRKLQRQRERVRYITDYDDPPSAEPGVMVPLLKAEQRRWVQHRLKELPDNYREVISAYYIEEKSYRQIAEEQQVEVKTIETKLYRARNWMRKHWKEDDF